MLIAVSILAGVMCMTSCGKKDAPSKAAPVSTEQKNTDKKYEMLLSEEASIKADEVTAHCIFRNTDYDSISEQYGITGKRPASEEEYYPFIVIKTKADKPEDKEEIIAWSGADSTNELMSEKDADELKTVIWCKYYTKTASYSGTEEKGTSEGVIMYYVDSETGQILESDEMKPRSLDLHAVGKVPNYKINHVMLMAHILDHIEGKDID